MDRREEKRLNIRYMLLRNWYGKERAKTEMAAHSPQPVDVNTLIDSLCDAVADPEVADFIALETNWKQIVGAQMAAYARPARLQGGVLSLEVRHSSLIRELQPSLDLFLGRIREMLGSQVCTSIKLVPSGGVSRGR